MRYAIAMVAVLALAAIAGSAGSVLTKDYPARLAVSVEGVPGYVYYDRAYDVTIEYANLGGGVSGPVELMVQLPETFALADRLGDPARHGERFVWTLDGLDTGERGSVTLTLQGTLPDDLTNAVYDLPGYAGHTAFVEGFELAASLTAGAHTALTLAVADTGAPEDPNLTVAKLCALGDTSTDFSINRVGTLIVYTLDCGEAQGGPTFEGIATLQETPREGYLPPIFGGDCTSAGVVTIIGVGNFTCTVTNLQVPVLIVEKTCIGGDVTFSFTLTPDGGAETAFDVPCGETSDPIPLTPDTAYELEEVGPLPEGWFLTGLTCQINGGTGAGANPVLFVVGGGGEVMCDFTNTFDEDGTDGDGTDGDGDPVCPVCCPCGVDVDITIVNENITIIGIDNDNTNNNQNDNANDNDNENDNENENNNENANTQNQTNNQDQDNENTQANNIDSSPEVNISGVASSKPADPKPSVDAIKPPSTGDAGLAEARVLSTGALLLAVVIGTASFSAMAARREG